MTGYSGTPLPQKLGIKPQAKLGLWAPPEGFAHTLGSLPTGVTTSDISRGRSLLDVLICFVSSYAELKEILPRAQARLDPHGGLWLCWRKKSALKASGAHTDVTEDHVRGLALRAGLVDNKVCAIDASWSGLRVVVRLEDRPARTPAPKTSRKTEKRTVMPRRKP